MERAIHPATGAATSEEPCANCGRILQSGWVFSFKTKPGFDEAGVPDRAAELTKCTICALRHRPMLKKSLAACLVVGTILTALNQGDAIVSGQWTGALYWKIPLTYCVPFLVATYGALVNNRK